MDKRAKAEPDLTWTDIDLNTPLYRTQMLYAAAVAFSQSTEHEAAGHAVTALEMLGEQIAEIAVIFGTIEKAQMTERCRSRSDADLERRRA